MFQFLNKFRMAKSTARRKQNNPLKLKELTGYVQSLAPTLFKFTKNEAYFQTHTRALGKLSPHAYNQFQIR
jgi:hypothetical protein